MYSLGCPPSIQGVFVAQIRPFAGVRFSRRGGADISKLIAPPYDVLNEQDRTRLQAADAHNIVNVDLPHIPPKTAGPDELYDKANIALRTWLKLGVLARDGRPALYPYTQTYDHGGRTFHRRRFITLVRPTPFRHRPGLPHEKTHDWPVADP